MKLQVLLVEDSDEDMAQFVRDLPGTFEAQGYDVHIDAKKTFEDGLRAAKDPLTRYDLVISDTYRGAHENRDAAVLEMVAEYQSGKFCPLIVISSGVCPEELEATPFVRWAGKDVPCELEDEIQAMLKTGIPQTARKLHDELDNEAGTFLWGFIEENWSDLEASAAEDVELLERIIRRRAAIALSDLVPSEYAAIKSRYGLEYYLYPALKHDHYSLGDILVDKKSQTDFRVILTPHCHLFPQSNQSSPKAEHVLTIRTVPVSEVLGEKITNAKKVTEQRKDKKLGEWARSPADTGKQPKGRHWYLPKFLEIPHLFCDFLQVESLPYDEMKDAYRRVATLVPPFAEALQECFSSFYGTVGIPGIAPKAIRDIIDDAP